MNRRDFLKSTLAATAAAGLSARTFANEMAAPSNAQAKADAMIFIWLPGGVAQTDTWDPKHYTPYMPGMKGCDLLGTCPIISTAADGISFGAGLENLASVMDKGAVLRSLANDGAFGDVHLKAQHQMMTGYPFPAGVKPPSMGAVVARTLGRLDPSIPGYIAIGREVNAASAESAFIQEYQGPGFYGPRYAPLMISDPAMLQLESGAIATVATDGPGQRFAAGCVLARRLVEAGARFVQVDYPYEPFGGFDAHEYGARRMMEMKRRIDLPIAQLVRDLDERGLLGRTLVVVASEFGRTVSHAAIEHEKQYGFHGHFSAANAMLFFGGGFKRGFAYGKTADRHPMVPIENSVKLEDVHATIYASLGITPHMQYLHDGSPFYITNGGKPIGALLASPSHPNLFPEREGTRAG
ncbi:MAG TPA: DUF1501 domain-containing protein [Tepidisphaeraceae bacterium]|nr:DUF1501 domain-containing protein [Tepidisphaeraceae bacterium]